MGVQEDAELVRRGYEAFIAGDMEWLNGHLHENVVWHAAGTSVLAGDHRGRDNVIAFLVRSLSIALPEFEIHDIAASPDHVVALLNVTWKHRHDDRTFHDRNVQVFHLDNGRVIHVWSMREDQAGYDEFIGAGR